MATPYFYIDFPFSGLSPLSGKIFGTPPPPSDSIFGRSYVLIPFNKGGGGVPKFQLWSMCRGVSLDVYTLCS